MLYYVLYEHIQTISVIHRSCCSLISRLLPVLGLPNDMILVHPDHHVLSGPKKGAHYVVLRVEMMYPYCSATHRGSLIAVVWVQI